MGLSHVVPLVRGSPWTLLLFKTLPAELQVESLTELRIYLLLHEMTLD